MKSKNIVKRNNRLLIVSGFFGIVSLLLALFVIVSISSGLYVKSINRAKAATNNFIVNTNMVGPFDKNCGDSTIDFTLKSSVYMPKVRETVLMGTDADHLGYSKSSAVHAMTANINYNSSLALPTSQIGNYGSRYIRIIIRDENTKTTLYEHGCTVSRMEKDLLNINYHLGDEWSSNTLAFKIENSEFLYGVDHLSVEDTLDFIAVDYYYRLDLSSVTFAFSSLRNAYDKAEIYFEDEYDVFPYIDKDENNEIHLDMSINISDDSVATVSYKQGFYVDPVTLDMSLKYRPGFRPTNYFYFPVNAIFLVVDYKFNFEIQGLGLNESTFLLVLDYDVSQRLIGRCDLSEYCVTGGVVA